MKKKMALILAVIILFIMNYPFTANASTKYRDSGYKKYGITVNGRGFYYKGKRIRIFQDMKADKSFVKSFVDQKGVLDIQLLRNKHDKIRKVKCIPEDEANEILEDYFGYIPEKRGLAHYRATDNMTMERDDDRFIEPGVKKKKKNEYTDIFRCRKKEVPRNVQRAVASQCKGDNWYIIKAPDRQYVYKNHIKKDFAYQVAGKTINISGIGKPEKCTVLLSIGNGFRFKLNYNGVSVSARVIYL